MALNSVVLVAGSVTAMTVTHMSWISETTGCDCSSSRTRSRKSSLVEPVTTDLRPARPLAVALALVKPLVIVLD